MTRVVIAVLFAVSPVCFVAVHAADSDKAETKAAAKSDASHAKALVYIGRNSPVGELKSAVAEFLQDTDSNVVADATSNVLLVQTAAENQDRVIALLQQLDRAPKTLRIQMHLLKAQGGSLAEIETASLTGKTDDVLKSIKSLESTGRLHVAKRVELTAIENNPTFLQIGNDVQLVTATTNIPGRGASSNYTTVPTGTMFKVQARLSGESDIVLEIDFENSEVDQQSADKEEAPRPVRPNVSRLTLQTTSRIHDGESLLVSTSINRSTSGDTESYMVLTASIDKSGHMEQVAKLHSSAPKPAPTSDVREANRVSDAESLDARFRVYATRLLAKYDKNNDKALDAEERSTMSKDCSDADTDKDGLVTAQELAIWMKR